jgi:RHS repeat-associated protein
VEQQTTQYVYGTEANLASPAVRRFDVLVGEIYPDSDDTYNPTGTEGSKFANGTDATYDRVEYTYDYASRKLTWKLQDTTLHTYNYDSVGRLLSDVATTLGSGIDGAIRRIESGYDDLSRRSTVSSYSATSAGTLLNQVSYTYDGWGNELSCLQGHEGTATGAPGYTKTFADGAVSGEAKYVRLASMAYPNARVVYHNYLTSGVGFKLSRVDNVANDASGTTKFSQYTFLGQGSIVKIAHPAVTGGLNLDLGTGTGNPAGWDDFGRIDDQKWQNDAASIKDRYQYGYDRTSNRTFRDNLTASAKDHFYPYDGLDRVTTAKQGDLNAGRTDITGTPAFQETWTLESLGNWRQLVQTTSGTTTLNQTRTHTKANETTTINASVGTNWGDGVLDRNGNMTRVPKPSTPNELWQLTYDAWNRLVLVVNDVGGATIAKYKYDGLHRRTVKLKPNGANWDRRDYYYSCEWQVVEERELLNTASQTTVATVPKFQWLWDIRYIDAVLLRDENKDGDGDCVDGTDQRLYYAQDANFNTTALLDTSGNVVERVLYDAYGRHTLYQVNWTTVHASTVYNNEVLYASYRLNPESGMYQVRHREYHPTLGRWVQRDRAGYVDGANLQEYTGSNPAVRIDPSGLEWVKFDIVKRSWIARPIDMLVLSGGGRPSSTASGMLAAYWGAMIASAWSGDHGDTAKKDGGFRLWSSREVKVCCENDKMVAHSVGAVVHAVGKEIFLQPNPGVVFRDEVKKVDEKTLDVAWAYKGDPHFAAEIGFQFAGARNVNSIWHFSKNRIYCDGNYAKIRNMEIDGSRFPSHALFFNGIREQVLEQGLFNELWVSSKNTPSLVRGYDEPGF